MENNHITEDSVVCSEHFLFTNFYVVNGVKKLWHDAVPTAIQFCIICLNTDCKLVSISQYKLKQLYENLTGHMLSKEANLCVECAVKLINFKKFRDKSLTASSLLTKLVHVHKIIRKEHLTSVNCDRNQLASNLICKVFKPNHYDLHVYEYAEGDAPTELVDIYTKATEVIVKDENKDNGFVDQENNEVEFENGHILHDYIKVEYLEDIEQIVCDNSTVDDEEVAKKADVFVNDDACDDPVWIGHLEDVNETDIQDSITEDKVYGDMQLLDDHMKTHSQDHVDIKMESNSHEDSSQRFGTSQNKLSRAGATRLHEIDAGSKFCNNFIQEYMNLESSPEQNNVQMLNNAHVNIDTFTLKNSEIKSEIHTNDIIDDRNLVSTRKKILGGRTDQNLQVLSYNANKQRNCDSELTETDHEENNTKNTLILSYDGNSDNVVIDTIQTGIKSENDVVLDEIHYEEQICKDEPDTNNSDIQINEHNDQEFFCCHICFEMFTKSEALKDHMELHTGDKPYGCRFCDFRSTQRGSLQRHEMSHNKDNIFMCHFCSVTFNHSEDLMDHLKWHVVDKPYSCGICYRIFVQKRNLLTHMKTHTGEKSYSCKYCDYKCIRRRSLVEHERIHASENPFKCTICDYKCSTRNLLAKHCRIHAGEITYVEAMKEHCNNIDPKAKLYMCQVCAKLFSTKYNYKAHMNMHTGEKVFVCHYCGKKFAVKGNLVFHLRTHTGEKPFSCEICDYKFSTSTNLKRHLKTHTGEKPYSCSLCPYKSVQSNDIRSHMRSHSDERPFACELCEYKCKSRRTLRNHMRVHIGESVQKKIKGNEVEFATEVRHIEENFNFILN